METKLTASEIETLKLMALLAELKIEELRKENNPSKQMMLDLLFSLRRSLYNPA